MALIESGMNPNAVSRRRAVGLWQFMSWTGKRYGLTVDPWVDERRDPWLATDAAIRMISELNDQFGSLYLAAAAYDAGPGKIQRGTQPLRARRAGGERPLLRAGGRAVPAARDARLRAEDHRRGDDRQGAGEVGLPEHRPVEPAHLRLDPGDRRGRPRRAGAPGGHDAGGDGGAESAAGAPDDAAGADGVGAGAGRGRPIRRRRGWRCCRRSAGSRTASTTWRAARRWAASRGAIASRWTTSSARTAACRPRALQVGQRLVIPTTGVRPASRTAYASATPARAARRSAPSRYMLSTAARLPATGAAARPRGAPGRVGLDHRP